MKKVFWVLPITLVFYSCLKNLCMGDGTTGSCEIFNASPINDGKALNVRISKVDEYDYILIRGHSTDGTVELYLKDDTTVVFNEPFVDLIGEMRARCYECSGYILWFIMFSDNTLKLSDTTYNALEVDTGGNTRVVKGNMANPPYIKFVKIDTSIYAVGNGIKISYPGRFKIAPDTGYYDTIKVSGEHALWITSNPQMYGKLKVSGMYNDSITVWIGFRKDIKGLKWIE
ncbi:MAG: hypothetical protein ABIL16_07565 [candidate division WOR-3 bacterium]